MNIVQSASGGWTLDRQLFEILKFSNLIPFRSYFSIKLTTYPLVQNLNRHCKYVPPMKLFAVLWFASYNANLGDKTKGVIIKSFPDTSS